MDVRDVLAALEEEGGPLEAAVAYVAVQAVEIGEEELRGARRRALLLLASGGDPRRDVEPGSRAVAALAGDLDGPGRRLQLRAALADLRSRAEGLASVSATLDALLADDELAWLTAASALLAEELA